MIDEIRMKSEIMKRGNDVSFDMGVKFHQSFSVFSVSIFQVYYSFLTSVLTNNIQKIVEDKISKID